MNLPVQDCLGCSCCSTEKAGIDCRIISVHQKLFTTPTRSSLQALENALQICSCFVTTLDCKEEKMKSLPGLLGVDSSAAGT